MDLPRTPPPPADRPAADQQPTPPPAPTGTAQSGDRSTAFRPVTGGDQMQSGEKLLVEAYAVIWVIVLALVLLSWRRQKQIDARVASLAGAIDKAREADEKGAR